MSYSHGVSAYPRRNTSVRLSRVLRRPSIFFISCPNCPKLTLFPFLVLLPFHPYLPSNLPITQAPTTMPGLPLPVGTPPAAVMASLNYLDPNLPEKPFTNLAGSETNIESWPVETLIRDARSLAGWTSEFQIDKSGFQVNFFLLSLLSRISLTSEKKMK